MRGGRKLTVEQLHFGAVVQGRGRLRLEASGFVSVPDSDFAAMYGMVRGL